MLAVANVALANFVEDMFVAGLWVWGACNGKAEGSGKKGDWENRGSHQLDPAH